MEDLYNQKVYIFVILHRHLTGNIANNSSKFRRRVILNLLLSGRGKAINPTVHNDLPFGQRSFEVRSTFNPIGLYQLEPVLSYIENELHGTTLRQ